MNILAIHDEHNAAAALLQEGKITYAVSEERLTRVKNEGGFPSKAIKRALGDSGLTVGDLDRVVFCSIRAPRPEWVRRELILKRYRQYCERTPDAIMRLRWALNRHLPEGLLSGLRRALRPGIVREARDLEKERLRPLKDMGVPEGRITYFDHHLCHAAGAYYAQGVPEGPVLCLTCDGGGDGNCASVSIGEGGRLKRIAAVPVGDSIAKLYALITFIMGLVPLEHEYKLMGLAPYADEERVEGLAQYLESHFLWNRDSTRWLRRPGLPPTSHWYEIVRKGIRFQRFDVVAGGFQRFVERMMVRWARGWLVKTGLRRVALSGGIFMNVKMNKLIMELDEVDGIYVLPSCGDETNPIGGCYLAAIEAGMSPGELTPLASLYLGPYYSEGDIRDAVSTFQGRFPVSVTSPEPLEREVARLLAEGQIVARYNGREEFGARALGNRSILADPSRQDTVREINQMIKCRDFWMPFAGTMTEDQARDNLVNPKGVNAPYMIMTFDTSGPQEDYRAATHPYDGTIRPQVLESSWNPGYHRILTEFEEFTGRRGGVLNTSFNLHGYPIVSSPEDALEVFEKSGLRYLAIGKYLLAKTAG